MAGVFQGSILFLPYTNDLRDNVISDIAIYAEDTSLYSICELEFESNLWDTVEWDRTWIVDFNAGKNQLVSLGRSHNSGAIDVETWVFL